MEHQVSSTLEGATGLSLTEMSVENSEMAIGEDERLQYSDPFETDTVVGSPACITLSSRSAYTKLRSRITVPAHKVK